MRVRVWLAMIGLGLMALSSCRMFGEKTAAEIPAEPTYSTFHQPDFVWENVGRVVLLPLLNESPYTKTDEEVIRALAAELQQLGRFEVVIAPPDDTARLSSNAHRNGKFDERKLLDLAKLFQADVLIYGTVNDYSPYPRPRLGIDLQVVSTRDLKTVASIDGLWDSTHSPIANQMQEYYRSRPVRRDWIKNHVIPPDDGFADEIALQSPALFQRWVAHQCAGLIVQGYVLGPPGKP
jgi:hypothetical protein